MFGWIKVLIIPGIVIFFTLKHGRSEWKDGNKWGGLGTWLLCLSILLITIYQYWTTIRFQ